MSSSDPENICFTVDQKAAYESTFAALNEESDFLAPIPTVVSVDTEVPDDDIVTLITPSRGHHELFRALEVLEGLEKEEQTLAVKTPLMRRLTELVTGERYANSQHAMQSLEVLGQAVPRRVCQHPFKKNDIVWVCRTCQADETCVLCHGCFSHSQHEGHDVAFYHAQAGGCCDCGDPDAWDPAGFCPRHGPDAVGTSAAAGGSALPSVLVERVRGVVPSCVDWMVQTVAANAETAYARANPPKRMPKAKSIVAIGSAEQRTPPRRSLTEISDDDEIFEDSFPLNMPRHRAHAFSPTAASSSSSSQEQQQIASAVAEVLGSVGREGHGLYLVLHADDIHSKQQISEALKDFLGPANYYTDTLLGKLVRALLQYGQLVVWGTMELVQECGATQVHLWMDGDKVAAGRIGALILERASRLTRNGMFCSILTRNELILEQRAVAVLQWLSSVARSCDPLCLTVAECILPNRHLVPLLLADFKMNARVTKAWYSLLLTLLAVPTFKSQLAAAYCDTYRAVTAKYARGMGVLERSGYTLSVQFLNRVTYVIDLVQGRDLLGKLGKALLETFTVASQTQSLHSRLDPNHFVLTHRRYSPCISDFKCVLNVNGMPRVIAAKGGTFLTDWISVLSHAQFMDAQVWRHWGQGHVEDESRGWVGAFNASISLGSLFERLLCWSDEETSPIETGPLSKDLMSCVELTFHILTKGIDPWQRSERLIYEPTAFISSLEPFGRAPASLPFSTIAANHGSALAMRQLPISQVSPFSFHLPLHRFVACCLRELCLRKNSDDGGISDLLQRLRTELPAKQYDELFEGLMEFPMFVLSPAAQIRVGLWRRNGSGLNDQVLNYAEPPFCRNMRDADLLMTQFATIGRTRHQSSESRSSSDVGMSFLVNLMLHRLGIFDFVGLAKAPNWNITRYLKEVADGLYPAEHMALEVGGDDSALPWTYSPARDSSSSMQLLEEFLHFICVFITELPPCVPTDKVEQTQHAKLRLFREVIHRLASGPKTHSELSEVHHVLSHWDNVLLSEEGKLVNPDDATGAALATVLADIADRKISRGKMEPDKWEMRLAAWESYDPAFFHISLRSHQTAAAEGRPKPAEDSMASFGWEAKPYAPRPIAAHPFFERLRRDATSDITVLAVAYRVLHLHCRVNVDKRIVDLRGKSPYENSEKSETALARTIHLLTLGVYAWKDAQQDDKNWRERGGGSAGSIFFNRANDISTPTARCWVEKFLLAEPRLLLDCDWYEGEEQALVLLQHLAVNGGVAGGFIAQDSAVRSGAAWLCEFAVACCPKARTVINPVKKVARDTPLLAKAEESEIEKRKKMARDKAMASMKAQAAKFAAMMEVDLDSDEDNDQHTGHEMSISAPGTPVSSGRPGRKTSFGSTPSASSSFAMGDNESGTFPKFVAVGEESYIPPRLLQSRPRCIICNDEDGSETGPMEKSENDDGEGQRKKSRRRAENALGFVGYVQASTVLKGGCPPPELGSLMSPVCEFVGTHVALCGHAVHSECCESYLATVSHREDRQIGKRDEFRCPLCQRLSNCLVPFIDVGVDWIDSPTGLSIDFADDSLANPKSEFEMQLDSPHHAATPPVSLHDFLESTPWWVTRRGRNVTWDGQSAFIERISPSSGEEGVFVRKPSRIRSLKKKDLYAAWNAMMHTPRLVRRRLRRASSRCSTTDKDSSAGGLTTGEESVGETVVWRRFMDQISDVSYRADSKRLGDDHLHNLFGEFRHYIVEKYAYHKASRPAGNEPTDWPSCLFAETLSENRRQEMSREKLLSKLLLSIQAFTYSCCCEAFEARREFRKSLSSSSEVAKELQDSSIESVLLRFGISGVVCDGRMILMPRPSAQEDGGAWPFNGRLGKLRYLGLSVMAASGAVAADLVQLVLPFPIQTYETDPLEIEIEQPDRAPIAYPVLFGNILTHVVAAMCATCGRARARSDSLDVVWPIPFSARGSFAFSDFIGNLKTVDPVVGDCEGFLKLGMLARMLQVLLGSLDVSPSKSVNSISWIAALKKIVASADGTSLVDPAWMQSCVKLLEIALSSQSIVAAATEKEITENVSLDQLHEACTLAAAAASRFLVDAGTIFQVLVPGGMAKYVNTDLHCESNAGPLPLFKTTLRYFKLEPIDQMLGSYLVQEIVANWFDSACRHVKAELGFDEASLRRRLYRTQGFRVLDWPSAGEMDNFDVRRESVDKDLIKTRTTEQQPHDDVPSSDVQIASVQSQNLHGSTADILRAEASPTLLAFNSKKSVSLLGGFPHDMLNSKINTRPRVAVIPTSYTDLYAELASLMPDCEQTAVCLICGEVLNASGKSECTRHSYKCGAGAGLFFLLQECSGLIMHKSKAAYIHSPYVDSHGETPQYRGRPLNLDLDRYEHLREVWFSHGVRQKVVAERGSSRQVILPDFY